MCIREHMRVCSGLGRYRPGHRVRPEPRPIMLQINHSQETQIQTIESQCETNAIKSSAADKINDISGNCDNNLDIVTVEIMLKVALILQILSSMTVP